MDLSAALVRARAARKSLLSPLAAATEAAKSMMLALKVGEQVPGGGAHVAAGGAPDPTPGTLAVDAFSNAGSLPPATHRRRRARKQGEAIAAAVDAGMVDPGTRPHAMVPAADIDAIDDPLTVLFQGLAICIDRPAGFTQVRTDGAGKVLWSRTYSTNYGYLPGTAGGDDDELDCFVGPDTSAPEVYWFCILNEAGAFDEYKLVFGASSEQEAAGVISAHIPPQFVAPGCAVTTVAQIAALLGKDPIERESALVLVTKALDAIEPVTRQDGEVQGDVGDPVRHDVEPTRHMRIVTKSIGELQYVRGIVLEPEVVDAQGEVYSAEVIRESAWNWASFYQNFDIQHVAFANDRIRLVESWIAPCDLEIDGQPVKAGTWLVGAVIEDPALWAAVKRGELTGWSMNGLSRGEPVDPGGARLG